MIAIKTMNEMPPVCVYCPYCIDDALGMPPYCVFNEEIDVEDDDCYILEDRPKECPLVEVADEE